MEKSNDIIPILEEKLLRELYSVNFTIPNYQRPYKWKASHVIQLLDDLYQNIHLKSKELYRIGSIIIHEDKGENNIVDGQQRLTTLSMILYYLEKGNHNKLVQNHNFKDSVSKNNLAFNYRQIQNWFDAHDAINKSKFLEDIQERSQFVVIKVSNPDEAFQLFDSQNSRGKELYPHDLLKAFHLREMANNGDSEQIMESYAEKWEMAIRNKTATEIIDNHLFRIRNWTKGVQKYQFTKSDLAEFKGISLNEVSRFPYQKAIRVLAGAVENAQKDYLLRNFNVAQSFPFQITMPIINGKNFFDYVFHYIDTKEKLFDDDFKGFYNQRCEYPYSGRIGDQRVKNLFLNLCLSFVDRFGYDEFSETIYRNEFYKNAYQLRLDNKSISESSILTHSKAMRFFNMMQNSYYPTELNRNLFCNYSTSKTDFVKGTEEILKFLTEKN